MTGSHRLAEPPPEPPPEPAPRPAATSGGPSVGSTAGSSAAGSSTAGSSTVGSSAAESATAGTVSAVPAREVVELAVDAAALVCSDLHLRHQATAASRAMERDLVARLGQWTGPGVVVLNGDLVELWGDSEATVDAVLDAHPALTAALSAFTAEPDRRVVVVVGNHDAAIAFDGVSAGALARRLGASCALSVDLAFATAAGRRIVRCEHGHAFDPANRLRDRRNPLDTPLGQHVVQEVLPEVRRLPMLADVESLADPNTIGQFLASRLVYRRLGRHLWWLLAPLLLALTLRTPALAGLVAGSDELGATQRWLVIVGVGLAIDVMLLLLLAVLLARAVYGAMAGSRLGPRGARLNGAPRAAASALCADGLAGFITGHTHQPELAPVPGGFYGNSGCGVRCVEAWPARLLLPPVFGAVLRRSWIELDVRHDVRARLVIAESELAEGPGLERVVARRQLPVPPEPAVVATLPGGAGWPLRHDALSRRARQERVRLAAAVMVSVVAALGLASALTTPFRPRLRALLEVLPVQVPQTAAASVVFVGTALLLLAWGLRRGRRLAWAIAVGLLSASAVLHLLKGLDVEEAAVATVVAAWLAWRHDAFPTRPDSRRVRAALVTLVVGGALVIATSVGLALLSHERGIVRRTVRAAVEQMVGRSDAGSHPWASPVVAPALLAAGLSLLLVVAWLLIRPRLRHAPTPAQHQADRERARRVVTGYGGDTLSYFALRDDKQWFFTGDCVVAYDVRNGVCLVSPDPIGPPQQWAAAWADFAAFVDRNGWPIAVIGAGPGWLPIYEQSGLRPVYLGDEAIVDCAAFSLEGRPMKGLRGGYGRVRRAGYTVTFHDPAGLPADVARGVREITGQSRRGGQERGFSMTLSRLLDPADTGLLLAVARDRSGRVDAFCHWVPAADIAGWSLDVMRRRTDAELPNGLMDFVVIETIEHLRAAGNWGLALNFAVLRAVLAGDRGEGLTSDLQRRLLQAVAGSTQMESLWRYNAKYQPLWRPRYVVFSGLSTAAAQVVAIAAAEGVTEVPVVGRFLARLP